MAARSEIYPKSGESTADHTGAALTCVWSTVITFSHCQKLSQKSDHMLGSSDQGKYAFTSHFSKVTFWQTEFVTEYQFSQLYHTVL